MISAVSGPSSFAARSTSVAVSASLDRSHFNAVASTPKARTACGDAVGVVRRAVIMDRHVPAIACQVQGDGASQPFGGAGDQNSLGHIAQ